MGYQPGLDGIRAVSVVAVILYHAGFSWMHGGFLGVEVFFVVSGYLIASLMLEEHERTGGTALGQFWLRRARRLLPALFTMLVVVALWATFWGDEHLAQLRHDLLPAVFYVSNWWQIFFTDVPYFGTGDPPLLRHLWSLAVEEQWYLVFPLLFVVLVRRRHLAPQVMAGAAVAVMVFTAVAFEQGNAERTNFLYLSTATRCSGLLLGAAAAFVWRPWRGAAARTGELRAVDAAGFGALALLAVLFVPVTVESAFVYRGGLAVVSVLSLVAVAAVVHPGARRFRSVCSSRVLVEVGRRSYGLYLWHWPVFVFLDVPGDQARFLPAIALTSVLSELCFRLVETPIRQGAIGRWCRGAAEAEGPDRSRAVMSTALFAASGLVVVAALTARLVTAEAVDVARDDSDVVFEFPVATAAPLPTDPPGTAVPGTTESTGPETSSSPSTSPSTSSSTSTTLPTLPRSVVIIGDSQAHSLAINLPRGVEATFTISNGAINGCGVIESGRLVTARSGFRRTFDDCEGFASRWASSAQGKEVALVVLGAWEVFDLEVDGQLIAFGSPAGDALLRRQITTGVQALVGVGTQVALLEVPCMRPIDAPGAGVPALPERGDDARVAHLNDLLREVAAADPAHVTFVEGPDAWCSDPAIATDLAYRWDGVHVYKPGAKLILETITPALLAIPVV
jgi:peptidoglycan/LPS O-acetylase OafA/YrhL